MLKQAKLPAHTVAQALILNAQFYGDEKGKECSRYRFTKESLRRVSGWQRLSAPFLQELSDEMFGPGWTMIELSDTEHAMIETRKISVWPKLSMKRVARLAKGENPEEAIDESYYAYFPVDDAQTDTSDD